MRDSQIISRVFYSTKSFKMKIFYENMYMKNGDILYSVVFTSSLQACIIHMYIIYSYKHVSQILYEVIV